MRQAQGHPTQHPGPTSLCTLSLTPKPLLGLPLHPAPPVIPGDTQELVEEVTVNASSAVTLECPALGNPAPALSWFQNGLPVSPSPRLQVLEEGQVLKVGTDPSQGKSTGNQGTISSRSYKGPLEYGDVTCTTYGIYEVLSWSRSVHKYQSLLANQERLCHTQGQPRLREAAPCKL